MPSDARSSSTGAVTRAVPMGSVHSGRDLLSGPGTARQGVGEGELIGQVAERGFALNDGGRRDIAAHTIVRIQIVLQHRGLRHLLALQYIDYFLQSHGAHRGGVAGSPAFQPLSLQLYALLQVLVEREACDGDELAVCVLQRLDYAELTARVPNTVDLRMRRDEARHPRFRWCGGPLTRELGDNLDLGILAECLFDAGVL